MLTTIITIALVAGIIISIMRGFASAGLIETTAPVVEYAVEEYDGPVYPEDM